MQVFLDVSIFSVQLSDERIFAHLNPTKHNFMQKYLRIHSVPETNTTLHHYHCAL